MDKGLQFIWRNRRKRLAVLAAIVVCIMVEIILAACAENTSYVHFVWPWPMLAVMIVWFILTVIVLPRVISKEMAREKKIQASIRARLPKATL